MKSWLAIWFGLAAMFAGLTLDSLWLDFAGALTLASFDDEPCP